MRFTRCIESVQELLEGLAAEYNPDDDVWFRGQRSEVWSLVPSLARPPHGIEKEPELLRRFQQNALQFLDRRPESDWDWLFLMQHYGAPTRLLDWTESALVGLFFAVEGTPTDDIDGAVWCLSPTLLNRMANIALDNERHIPCLGFDDILELYSPKRVAAEPFSNPAPVAVLARRQFPRMFAQLGVFTLIHRTPNDLSEYADQKHIGKFLIPAKSKALIRNQLKYLGVSELTLFPELASVARLLGR